MTIQLSDFHNLTYTKDITSKLLSLNIVFLILHFIKKLARKLTL